MLYVLYFDLNKLIILTVNLCYTGSDQNLLTFFLYYKYVSRTKQRVLQFAGCFPECNESDWRNMPPLHLYLHSGPPEQCFPLARWKNCRWEKNLIYLRVSEWYIVSIILHEIVLCHCNCVSTRERREWTLTTR